MLNITLRVIEYFFFFFFFLKKIDYLLFLFNFNRIDEVPLDSPKRLESIPRELFDLGVKAIIQYMVDLYQSQDSESLYRTKLMVVGFEKAGKTTILDCLFPLTAWIKTKGDVLLTLYWFELEGKFLKKYKKETDETPHKLVTLEPNQWELEEGELTITLTPRAPDEKKVQMHFSDEKTKIIWVSRIKRLLSNTATDGIEIQRFSVRNSLTRHLEGSTLNFSVWDFAGQHDYYNVHHYFLSTRTIFLVIWKMIEGEVGLQAVHFWLKSLLAHLPKDDSTNPLYSIIIVGTFLDCVSQEFDDVNERRVQISTLASDVGLGNFLYHEVNCIDLDGIEVLRDSIVITALHHSYMGEKVPRTYLEIERGIELLREKHVDFPIMNLPELTHYCRTLAPFHFDQDLTQRALKLLHEWGECVYFSSPESLSHLVVLRPQFLTKEILGALFSPIQGKTRGDGIINHSQLSIFWPKHANSVKDLIGLLEKFEVCFTLQESGESFAEQKSIIPSLLPQTLQAPLTQKLKDIWSDDVPKNCFQLERIYNFNIIPNELVSRLLVRFHPYISNGIIWRRGVLLKRGDILSLLQAVIDHNRFVIKIRGPDRHSCIDMVQFIHEEVEKLLKFYPGVQFKEFSSSPYLSKALIDLKDIKDDLNKPFSQRELICPITHFPIKAENLMIQFGLEEKAQPPREKFSYLPWKYEEDADKNYLVVDNGTILDNDIYQKLVTIFENLGLDETKITKVMARNNPNLINRFDANIPIVQNRLNSKPSLFKVDDWQNLGMRGLREKYMQYLGDYICKFRSQSFNNGSQVFFFFFFFSKFEKT